MNTNQEQQQVPNTGAPMATPMATPMASQSTSIRARLYASKY